MKPLAAVGLAWTGATAASTRPDIHQGRLVWAVAFEGDSAAAGTEQRLHLYLTLDGDYLAALEDSQS